MKKYLALSGVVGIVCLVALCLVQSCRNDEPYEINQAKIDSKDVFTLNNNYLYIISDDNLVSAELNNGIIEPTTYEFGALEGVSVYAKDTILILASSDTPYGNRSYVFSVGEDGSTTLLKPINLLPCDQVAISGKYFFQSIRNGSECRPTDNNSIVVTDLSDSVLSPKVIPIATPYGLSVDQDLLFVCQGDNGLSIYNIQDPPNISLIHSYTSIKGEYADAANGLLIVTDKNTISQYDYTDLDDLKLLSVIPVQ